MLTLVCATRTSLQDFPEQTLLGRCLPLLGQAMPFGLRLFADNQRPLGECYNEAIAQAADDDVLVFVHDDVRIDDWLLGVRLSHALGVFDVVGVVGNRRRQPGQLTWYLQPPQPNAQGTIEALWDHEHLTGAIVHAPADGAAAVSVYGTSPSPVALLDGVLLAVRVDRLRAKGVQFDASLGFHFYDLDFCRSAQAAGLLLGTWPIAITHLSSGASVQSKSWAQSRDVYLKKWGG